MAGSVFGQEFRVSTFGESHGGAVGALVEGVTPGLELPLDKIQFEMDRRRPGQSDASTPRQESDTIRILSGIFEGKATGTPLMMMVENKDARPGAYEQVKSVFRPGHADYAYWKKYGIRDYRGGGRSSGRETAARVAAGAVAKLMLAPLGIKFTAYVKRGAGIDCKTIDFDEIERNIVRAADPVAAQQIIAKVMEARAAGDSVGGIVECVITGVPAGLGEPVFDKLDADLGKAMLSLGSVKGIEFGAGFAAADLRGSENNDQIASGGFLSNHAGGITGGISTGQDIVFRIAVKPTPSISLPQASVDLDGKDVECRVTGRHDPCIFARIVPVVEAMAAMVIADHVKRQAAVRS